jgi:hypothetical protein
MKLKKGVKSIGDGFFFGGISHSLILAFLHRETLLAERLICGRVWCDASESRVK